MKELETSKTIPYWGEPPGASKKNEAANAHRDNTVAMLAIIHVLLTSASFRLTRKPRSVAGSSNRSVAPLRGGPSGGGRTHEAADPNLRIALLIAAGATRLAETA
eukprot:CAMPEP_0175725034 /NCGR_PEP_ID=MMETSP0097-20121207/47555_1 /TAXON_ID=311494 /ORGANISM="Alexandrium monilatum, Strain CCMP3105" /LENGTH=104 /DNA_ID=CAMNT_0017032803 /DNA_START=238 /DNA_END=549 /DNA_ORIENTATION=+